MKILFPPYRSKETSKNLADIKSMLTEVLKANPPINNTKQQKDIRTNSKKNSDSDNEHDDDDVDDDDDSNDSDVNDKYNTNTSHNDSAYASSSSSSYKYNNSSQQMAKPSITNSSPDPNTKYNTRNAVSTKKYHFIKKLFDILNSFLFRCSQRITRLYKNL